MVVDGTVLTYHEERSALWRDLLTTHDTLDMMKLKSKKIDPTEEPSILAQPGVVSAVRMFLTLFVIAHMLACVRVAGARITTDLDSIHCRFGTDW